MKLPIMQILRPPVTSSLLGQVTALSTPFSSTLNPRFAPDRISCSSNHHRTAKRIIYFIMQIYLIFSEFKIAVGMAKDFSLNNSKIKDFNPNNSKQSQAQRISI
jgi:hypothetical protein